jgi:diacylglycerol O-acyltransferase
MWALDRDPALQSSFMGVTILDGAVDVERLRSRLADAVVDVDVLRRRVVDTPFDLAPPRWELDPDFSLDDHLRRVSVPSPGTRRQLLDLAASIYAEPFDRARPLWRFTLVDGLENGATALLAEMHHVLSDGVGAVRISASFLDLGPDDGAPAPGPAPSRPRRLPADEAQAADLSTGGSPWGGPVGWLRAAGGAVGPIISTNAAATRTTAAAVAGSLSTAVRSPATGVAAVRALVRQLGATHPARSPLWAGRSHAHRFDALSLDLGLARLTAKTLGGTVNDVFVTLMAAAAGSYHRHAGVDVDELRVSVPISVRRDHQAGGNAWIPARVLVPVGAMPAADRFALVAGRLTAVKREPSLGLTDTLALAAGRLPRPLLLVLARQQVGTVDFACSNVRGAPFDLWVAGAHVEANHPMGPTAGVAFNATILSYRDSLDLGLNTDTGAVDDPDLLVRCIEDAAAELLALA